MQSLMILGRQPALGLAELESIYGAMALMPYGAMAAVSGTVVSNIDFDRLGGTIKLARVLTQFDSTAWRQIEEQLTAAVASLSTSLPEGKIQLGLSVYGLRVSTQQLLATGLDLKKVLKSAGRSVRLTPNTEAELSSASVLHNHLTGPTGCELIIISDGSSTILAQTIAVQDIDSYTERDRGRPKRDARVGMLPPKLAQIIINLAVGRTKVRQPVKAALSSDIVSILPEPRIMESKAEADTPPIYHDMTILDPFCGTGVVLQEALLMNYGVYGTDLEPRMIEYSQQNLDWLTAHFAVVPPITLQVADATNAGWGPIFTAVASEAYLGRPFTTAPSSEVLNQTVSDCNLIIKKFLKTIHHQLPAGAGLCLAIPAWQLHPGQFRHLPFLGSSVVAAIDSLAELGYNRISFEHVRTEDLLYYRAGQIVARELLVLRKISN